MAKRARSMALYERFLEAVEQRCSGAPEEEADAIALAKGFLAQHGDKVEAAWQRFGANGKLPPGPVKATPCLRAPSTISTNGP